MILRATRLVFFPVVTTLLVLFILTGGAPAQTQGVTDVDVLMVGNSYTQGTYTHFRGFADADPGVNLHLDIAASGGKTLWWHWENRDQPVYSGKTLIEKLKERAWRIVILQDYSTRASSAWIGLSPDRYEMYMACVELEGLIATHAPTAEIRFFQTWPRAWGAGFLQTHFNNDPLLMHLATRSAYGTMARVIDAKVVPIGEAWLVALSREESKISFLHTSDLSHASTEGGYLTGAVIYAFVFNRSPIGSTYAVNIPLEMRIWLQESAHLVWRMH